MGEQQNSGTERTGIMKNEQRKKLHEALDLLREVDREVKEQEASKQFVNRLETIIGKLETLLCMKWKGVDEC